jgi:DNA-binding protein HU-beta
MNQAELIEKIAQVTELNQAAVGQAVKATVNAILDALVAGEAVHVSGLGTFNVAARPAREGRNPQTGAAIHIAASRHCGSMQARPSKMLSIRRLQGRLPRRGLHHRSPQCGSKRPLHVGGAPAPRQVLWPFLAAPSSAYPAIRYSLVPRRNPAY